MNVLRIFKKELAGYLNSPPAYIFFIIFLMLGPALWFYVNRFFINGFANMAGYFGFVPWLFLFFVPALAMRIWAEEKRSGTDELLMTMPISDWEAVLGKYLAALALLAGVLVLTFPLPLTVLYYAAEPSTIDWGPVWCGYLACFLYGAAILAIGAWASSLTVNQIVAFIITVALSFILIIIGIPSVTDWMGGFGQTLAQFSLMSHFQSLYRGVIDVRDVAYYLSVIAFFLFLNVSSLESRKWS